MCEHWLAGAGLWGDVIINHISSSSSQFQDFMARGDDSEWAEMFLTLGSVFPDGATEEELAKIYRPRPGLPFTAMTISGQKRLVWALFQVKGCAMSVPGQTEVGSAARLPAGARTP